MTTQASPSRTTDDRDLELLQKLAVARKALIQQIGRKIVGHQDVVENLVAAIQKHGKRVFGAVGCHYCHGRSGQGGALNYPAPPLAKTELPFDGFKGVLRESPVPVLLVRGE